MIHAKFVWNGNFHRRIIVLLQNHIAFSFKIATFILPKSNDLNVHNFTDIFCFWNYIRWYDIWYFHIWLEIYWFIEFIAILSIIFHRWSLILFTSPLMFSKSILNAVHFYYVNLVKSKFWLDLQHTVQENKII